MIIKLKMLPTGMVGTTPLRFCVRSCSKWCNIDGSGASIWNVHNSQKENRGCFKSVKSQCCHQILCSKSLVNGDGGEQVSVVVVYALRYAEIEHPTSQIWETTYMNTVQCPARALVCNFDWHLAVIAGLIKIIDANPFDVCMFVCLSIDRSNVCMPRATNYKKRTIGGNALNTLLFLLESESGSGIIIIIVERKLNDEL